jgi:CBS domain containing-hemolysin-like protein
MNALIFLTSSAAAAGNSMVPPIREWHFTTEQVFAYIVVILFFVLLNGFFVASEFALVKVRDSQLQEAESQGRRGAKIARIQVARLDAYLSATQLGITLSSLALGMLGEPYIASMLQPLLYQLGMVSDATVHAVAVGFSYVIMTFLHVVVGEITPKSLAIRKALDTTLKVAPLLQLFYILLKPVSMLLNGCANLLLRHLFRIKPATEHERALSEEELRTIVTESQRSEVTDTEKDILLNVLDLNDRSVTHVLTPRNLVCWLDVDDPFAENLKKAIANRHTRYPVVEGHLDKTLGWVHVKDLLKAQAEHVTDLRRITRDIMEVPEHVDVDRLLKTFLERKQHIALVIDEYGGSVGIVTMDNLLERIVGDIQDEFDNEKPMVVENPDGSYTVDGLYGIMDLSERLELGIDEPPVATVGGYVTHLLGHLAREKDSVQLARYLVIVEKTDARRAKRLKFTPLSQEAEDSEHLATTRHE